MTVSASTGDSPAIESRRQLVEWFESGSTPKSDWAIGTEHEKFAFTRDDLRPIPLKTFTRPVVKFIPIFMKCAKFAMVLASICLV